MIEAPPEAESKIAALRLVPRTGWALAGVDRPESVAEHTFGMLMLALIAQEEADDSTLGAVLVHDLPEALTGDLVPRARRYARFCGSWPDYPEMEEHHLEQILKSFPERSREYFRGLWSVYQKSRGQSGHLVHALDKLEMLCQALEYERMGAASLDEFWRRLPSLDSNSSLNQLLKDLLAERERLKGRDSTGGGTESGGRFAGFIKREVYPAKRLRFDPAARHGETIAEQTFRLTFLACLLAVENRLDPLEAMRCALLQGLAECRLADLLPALRSQVSARGRQEALRDSLGLLPRQAADRCLALSQPLFSDSAEGFLAKALLARDYERECGVKPAGTYFSARKGAGIALGFL